MKANISFGAVDENGEWMALEKCEIKLFLHLCCLLHSAKADYESLNKLVNRDKTENEIAITYVQRPSQIAIPIMREEFQDVLEEETYSPEAFARDCVSLYSMSMRLTFEDQTQLFEKVISRFCFTNENECLFEFESHAAHVILSRKTN